MKIYTKTGDAGETGLFGGGRVPKDDPRVEAYGDVDELNSAIGVARATAPTDLHDALLESIQRDLFAIGGQLATPDPEKVRAALEKAQLSDERIRVMEAAIDQAELELAPLRAFVLPAGTPKAIVDAYHAALMKVMADKEVIEKFAGLGVMARSGSQADFRSFVAAETAKYAKLVADNNIKAD